MMKKIKIRTSAALLALLLPLASCDGLLDKTEVPEQVQAQFAALYPTVKNPDWDEEPEGFEAEFELSGRERTATFNAQGKLLQVEEEIESSSLPADAMAYLQQQYNKYEIEETHRVKIKRSIHYVVELEHKAEELVLVFDAQGRFVRKDYAASELQEVPKQQASLLHVAGAVSAEERVFAKPDAQWELPSELREVSGIALLPSGKMACVQDEKGSIYIYNLEQRKLEEELPFGSSGDYEGIAVNGATAYVLRSDGTVVEVRDFRKPNLKVIEHASVLAPGQNTEGLAFDKANNRLLVACKGHDKRLGQHKGIYALNLSDGTYTPEPVIKIPMAQEVLLQKSGKRKKNQSGYELLQPSSLEVNPVTGDYLLLDAVNYRIMVVDGEGLITRAATLNKDYLRQAEGLAFSSTGEMYIASEGGKKGKGVILKYTSPF